ncbi:glycosyltransferase family 4 protein [Rhizobium sp. WYJ-E13]|uniref:glycosyltransferase family 4 protein n=1 Tax=Rhizobium sp. WYJ-E13 TaxID=2849093 RepID=UPI001C1F1486|nr:glycosyltransferase family 4 protein [Rhizobium sp. WYJ-E13]QWW71982.1 glycosyltransferase family 4 protein [Rhizobium sp. WYJ-E13]
MLMKASAERAQMASVRHYVPGGCENGGGIGRLVGYITSSARQAGATHFVTDTRGPRWSAATSSLRLLGAILTMARDRIAAPARIHHIHVAGRGSTSRKLILTEAARVLGCSHILHLHDYDYASDFAARSPRQQALIRRMFQNADCVVALGQRDHVTLTTLLSVDGHRVVVIHNCVPDPGERRRLPAGQTPLIVFLGRLSERKGVPELLLALSHPTMKELQWRAVLAGDGPVEDYRRQAAAMGLSDLVEMPGWLGADEIKDLCARADILVLPSHAEGLAMAVIEGLAHGLAVVTTRVGAHEEVISDGKTGVFVPVGDQDALAAALAKLVTDPEMRAELSNKGRVHYLNHFSMTAYMRSIEKLYEAISTQPQARVSAS